MGRLPETPNVTCKTCAICNHPDRAQIERLVLSVGPSNPSLTLDVIADAFGVGSNELRVHALMHTPLALDFSLESEASLVEGFRQKAGLQPEPDREADDATSRQSAASGASALSSGLKDRLTDKLNLRESDMLIASANELLTTLSLLGRRIQRFATDNGDNSDQRLVNFCTNSMVSLYTGSASELRKTIEEINHMNSTINGDNDSTGKGIAALAEAINNSRKPTTDDE